MKVLRGTLTFILGLVLGIVLLIVAIAGVIVGVGTMMKVSDIPINIDNVISEDSQLYNQTILDALQGVLDDVHNFDRISMKELYDHYGISFFKELAGLDLTQKEFYTRPIKEVVAEPSIILDEITLTDVDELAKLGLADKDLPILKENLANGISTAINNIVDSINGNLTIRGIKDKLGIDLGVNDNNIFKSLQDIKLSDFGKVLNHLRINVLLDADTDMFIPAGKNVLYVKSDRYELVAEAELANPSAAIGAEKYVAGAKDVDNDGNTDALDERELRYVKKTVDGVDTYVVDNSCYDGTKGEFYRHYEYEVAKSAASEYFLPTYANRIDYLYEGDAILVGSDFISLNGLYKKSGEEYVAYTASTNPSGYFITVDGLSIKGADETYTDSAKYAFTDEELTKDSLLGEIEEGDAEYYRAHVGTAEAAIQTIAHMTISDLQNSNDILGNRRIKDLITITDETSQIIKQLQNSTLKSIGTDIDKLTIDSMLTLVPYEYEENESGLYVLVEDEDNGSYYTLFNPADPAHKELQRYDRKQEEKEYSSLVLQRLAKLTLKGLDGAMKSLSIADVLELDPDIYGVVDSETLENYTKDTVPGEEAQPDIKIFRYDAANRVYVLADKEYVKNHSDETFYKVEKSGSSNSILKKLAYADIEKMNDSLEAIMDDTMISELVTIISAYGVTLKTEPAYYEANGKYFIEYKEGVEEDIDDVDKGDKKYVYIYDGNGTYFLSKFIYKKATEAQTGAGEEVFYDYKPITDLESYGSPETKKATNAALLAKLAKGNIYYQNGNGEYVHNLQLCTYLISRLDSADNNTGQIDSKLFYRVTASTSSKNPAGHIYTSHSGDIYVKHMGSMHKIDGTDYTDEDTKLVYCTLDVYYMEGDPESGEEKYFVSIDDTRYKYDGTQALFSRQYCDDVYVADEAGDYVYDNGGYIAYNEELHVGMTRFAKKTGYVATTENAVYIESGSDHISKLTSFYTIHNIDTSATYYEQSDPVLRYLANYTAKNLNSAISTAKLQDMISIAPGTIFDIDEIRDSTLSDLGSKVQEVMRDMTVGELVRYGQVSSIPAEVLSVIKGATVKTFFSSLKYDAQSGLIYVDVAHLFGDDVQDSD